MKRTLAIAALTVLTAGAVSNSAEAGSPPTGLAAAQSRGVTAQFGHNRGYFGHHNRYRYGHGHRWGGGHRHPIFIQPYPYNPHWGHGRWGHSRWGNGRWGHGGSHFNHGRGNSNRGNGNGGNGSRRR